MYSLSIDYLFNRVYDVLLWIKYVWLFVLLRKSPDEYLVAHTDRSFDGLRDRGWFTNYLAQKDAVVPPADIHVSLWQRTLDTLGLHRHQDIVPNPDTDPTIDQDLPSDLKFCIEEYTNHLTPAQLKERYQENYDFGDHLRDTFGIGPHDSDGDGIPDSYEIAHGLNPNNADSDHDGLPDGIELCYGTNPLNNDTDHDGILDGRDEAPLDPTISAVGLDSDGDGVSDRMEGIIGSNVHVKDTDGDGIPDGMDSYPADANNVSQILPLDIHKATAGLHFSIQNPVLSFFTDLLSIAAIAIIIVLVYVTLRWLWTWIDGLNHYEHHFEHGNHGGSGHHVITDDPQGSDMPAGVPGLPVHEDAPSLPPTFADFEDHPRFAIVQGYMSSESEALWRIGIMEADNMLAEVLREKGYQGETVGEMLKNASFKTIRLAWDAHTTRNRIAHEGSDFQLTEREAKLTFANYESVFRELKVIR
jgi:hypothetical protein